MLAQAFSSRFGVGASRGLIAGLVVEHDLSHGGETSGPHARRQRRVELTLDGETDLAQAEVEPLFSRRRFRCSAK